MENAPLDWVAHFVFYYKLPKDFMISAPQLGSLVLAFRELVSVKTTACVSQAMLILRG
jgi:hypothetical protein